MSKKKVYKLKVLPKILIVVFVLLAIASIFLYKKYQEYLYRQTNEYKLLQVGYKEDEVKILLEKLQDKEIEVILNRTYNEFIPPFVSQKYFKFSELDNYLTQVVTEEEDFFKYHENMGTYNYEELVSLVNTLAYLPFYEETIDTDMEKGNLILVNKYHKLPDNYEPEDLVKIDIKYYYGDAKKIRKEVYDAFIDMWNEAHEQGIYLVIDSAFRSSKFQADVYKYYENLKGGKYADTIAARPNFSEHQTGLSLDIYSKECFDAKKFKDSKSYQWLINNAYKYGFILRYPEGKKKITGYDYESWHYRYVGKEIAKKIYEEGITLDEYYAFYLE